MTLNPQIMGFIDFFAILGTSDGLLRIVSIDDLET